MYARMAGEPAGQLVFYRAHVGFWAGTTAFARDDEHAAVAVVKGMVQKIDRCAPSIGRGEAVEIQREGGTDAAFLQVFEEIGCKVWHMASKASGAVGEDREGGMVVPADDGQRGRCGNLRWLGGCWWGVVGRGDGRGLFEGPSGAGDIVPRGIFGWEKGRFWHG